MTGRHKTALLLVGFGCIVLLVGAILHLIAAYPRVSAALSASNLNGGLESAIRAVFLMVGWGWIVIAIVTLIAAFTETRIRKVVVLFCGFAFLAQTPIWVGIMGWFVGNEMFVAAGILIVCGGLLFRPFSAKHDGAAPPRGNKAKSGSSPD